MEAWDSQIVSAMAIAIAGLSLFFSIRSWHASNRPFVLAYIETAQSGNMGIALNIVLENTGIRLARDIRLIVKDSDLNEVIADSKRGDAPKEVLAVFDEQATLPILPNSARVTASFGVLKPAPEGDWKANARLPIRIEYRDVVGRRKYSEHYWLKLMGSGSFSGFHWGPKRRSRLPVGKTIRVACGD